MILDPEDEAFNEIEQQAKQRKEAVLQALHSENERLGLYKDAYGQQEPVAWISPKGHIHFDPYLDSIPLYTHPPQHIEERNFCPRCGKRTNDIHTCTPPQENT